MNQPPANNPNHSLWVRVFASLPWGLLYGFASVLAFLARHVFRFKLSIARENLTRCFPQMSAAQINALLSAYYRQLGEVAVEFIKTASMSARSCSASTIWRKNPSSKARSFAKL